MIIKANSYTFLFALATKRNLSRTVDSGKITTFRRYLVRKLI